MGSGFGPGIQSTMSERIDLASKALKMASDTLTLLTVGVNPFTSECSGRQAGQGLPEGTDRLEAE